MNGIVPLIATTFNLLSTMLAIEEPAADISGGEHQELPLAITRLHHARYDATEIRETLQ
jgi:hypothetical protein